MITPPNKTSTIIVTITTTKIASVGSIKMDNVQLKIFELFLT
jgi:hypothetical protein